MKQCDCFCNVLPSQALFLRPKVTHKIDSREDSVEFPESGQPKLSTEELVVRESLLSYFEDVLRRLGPVKIDGPELQAELGSILQNFGRKLLWITFSALKFWTIFPRKNERLNIS
jgi:hypothetical protein